MIEITVTEYTQEGTLKRRHTRRTHHDSVAIVSTLLEVFHAVGLCGYAFARPGGPIREDLGDGDVEDLGVSVNDVRELIRANKARRVADE